jgi:uncharacterized membrane protein YozB (DUF420 family)
MLSHAALNATLNGTSAILLAAGYTAIRSGKIALHKKFMVCAFFVSCAFLVSYLIYHFRIRQVIHFQGQGWIRPVYFALLTSHTILAVVIVPMIIVTLRRAWLQRFDKHRVLHGLPDLRPSLISHPIFRGLLFLCDHRPH